MAKNFYMLYNSIVTALLLASISFKITWLEMSMNIGMLIPVYAVIVYVVFYAALRKKGQMARGYKLFTVGNLFVSGVVALLVLGIDSVSVVPAAIIREGLGINRVSFGSINIVICCFLAAGLAAILLQKTVDDKAASLGKFFKVCTAAIFVALICAYFLVPSFNQKTNRIVMLFASGDTTIIKEFINSYGGYAMAVSFLLMVFQSIMAPLPAFLITFSNASLFGWWQGAILSWTSAMVGAALCFYIARIFGRDVTEKFTTKIGLKEIDGFFEKYGAHSIVIARLLPFISFDIVSYAAGLTSMGFAAFFIATGVGQLPATIVYSYVGGMLTGGTRMFVTALLITFALFFLVYMLRLMFKDRVTKKALPKGSD